MARPDPPGLSCNDLTVDVPALTDVLAIGLVSVGVPLSRGVSADQMTAPVAFGPWRVPRWTIVPMIAIVGFLVAVAVLTAFSS